MLSTTEFAKWANANVVLFLHNTSLCDDEPYPDLLREKGGNGFPTVSYLASDGRFLKQSAFPATLETMQAGLAELEEWRALGQLAKHNPAARERLFRFELESGMLSLAEAREQLAKLEIRGPELAQVEQQLVNLEFQEILRATPNGARAAAGAKFYAMLAQDRVPSSRELTSFWQYIFEHAAAEGDIAKFESCLAKMKTRHAGDARVARYLPRLEQQLEQLRRQSR